MAHGRHWPGDVQLEYCEFCGVRLPAAKRIQATTQEYAGRWACPKCAPLVLNPSYLDYGGPGNLAPTPGETEPHSGVDWVTEIQGVTTYTSFYAGATLGISPSVAISTYPSVRAVPFQLPRRLRSNTIATITVRSINATGTLYAAIYKRTTGFPVQDLLVEDLGSFALVSGGTATFSPDLFVNGDGIYLLAFYWVGPGTLEAFAAADSDGTIPGTIVLIASTAWYTAGGTWPRTRKTTDWTNAALTVNFPAFSLTMEA